jgi:hypothetical protein
MNTDNRPELSWDLLAQLEPRLADLLERVQKQKPKTAERAARYFYKDLKPTIRGLVGWYRPFGPPILQSSRAYRLAHDTIEIACFDGV